MFFVEFYTGILSESVALIGDSLDMLADALAYGSSLYALHLGMVAKARAAQFKASLMVLLGLVVFGRAIYRTFYQVVPNYEIMGSIGFLALFANLVCLYFLSRHKNDDINMSSVWICSRNDIAANTAIIFATGLVFLTKSSWPDLIVGLGITILFLKSAFPIFVETKSILQSQKQS